MQDPGGSISKKKRERKHVEEKRVKKKKFVRINYSPNC